MKVLAKKGLQINIEMFSNQEGFIMVQIVH